METELIYFVETAEQVRERNRAVEPGGAGRRAPVGIAGATSGAGRVTTRCRHVQSPPSRRARSFAKQRPRVGPMDPTGIPRSTAMVA